MRPFGSEVGDDELRLLLKAPVAVAWWILTFAPELLKRNRLDLLMVGLPGGPAAADEGRPYQLLPLLLERPELEVTATVILWTPDAQFAPPLAATPAISLRAQTGVESTPATLFNGSLAEWWTGRQGDPPDLCLLMHPGFDQRAAFWAGLRLLFAAGVHVGCFARGPEKAERDAWLLRAYGYDVTPEPKPNPWARYRPELRGHGAWGSVAWELRPRSIPAANQAVDTDRLRRACDAQAYLQHEFEVWNPLQFIGQVQHAEDDASADPERFVGLPDHHALSLRTGEVWALEPEGRVPAAGIRLPAEVLATYPGDQAPGFERLMWAVEVYRNEFRPREAAALEDAGEAQVRHLRDEVAQCLQGAAGADEIAAITDYLRGGVGPTTATPGSEGLFAALAKGDWEQASRRISKAPALVNAEDADGRTPLFYAIRANYLDLARRWLEAGAAPDHLDHEGFAIIHDVVKRDDPVPVELLQRYGADLDLGTGVGLTPALLALRYGCWTVLGYLLSQHVDLTKTALAGAAVADQYEHVPDLPRVLRSAIEQQLGKRRVIPIAIMAAQRPSAEAALR